MYSEKYHVIYCDRNGKQFRLGIHEWDYVGASVRHKAAPVPFAITQETTSELKLGGIYPTRATVTLVSSKVFNMEELYTADERKYMVVHEPTDGTDQGKWYGNIIPNGFTEEMDNDVHYMILTASDNLPTLKLKLFTQDDGTNYGLPDGDFEQSFLWVAKEALKKTGLLLPIWTMVDVEPMLTNSGSVRSLSVGFVSPSTMRIIDSSNTIDDILSVGMSISVSGGVNDGVGLTVVSWTTTQQWDGSDYIVVTVSETVIDSGGFENVTLSFYADVPVSSLPDPLAITVHDVRTYIRDQDVEGKNYYEVNGSAMSTWDVLNNLAKQWNAKIYQNNGRWEIVRWNAFAVDAGEYQYFVYNSEGVQTGREDFGHDVAYLCKSTRFNFRPFGHSISMDRVLGAVGVNYRYKFKTDGDSLINLIKNGNLLPPSAIQYPPPTSNINTFTPEHWRRYNPSKQDMTLDFHPLPSVPGDYPPANIPYITMGNNGNLYFFAEYLSTASGYDISVGGGDNLKLSFWYRGRWRIMGADSFGSAPLSITPLVLRIFIRPLDPNIPRYQLVNTGPPGLGNLGGKTTEELSRPVKVKSQWVQYNQHHDDRLSFEVGREFIFGSETDNTPAIWFKYDIQMDPVPIAGSLVIEITGIGDIQLSTGTLDRSFAYSIYDPSGAYRNRQGVYSNREGDIAGFFAAKIVSPSSESVPLIHPYWYTNDGAYTDQIDDIEVLLGDDDGPDHVSNIYVMDGGIRKAIKSWDSWTNDFGWGALGLILAKSVMQQYYRPWRIIDGDFVASNVHWGSRIEFEQRPGERYALLRGSIDPIANRFSGTIVQVADTATPALPPGGNDGGSTVDPNWQPTGTVRCVRDENGENTGDQEQLEVDMNPSSQTSGQQRWTNIGENTGKCPIGEPIDFYWGASTLPIDPDTLEYFPYEKVGDEYQVNFDNDGTGKYLVFLHRAALGTVRSILEVEREESISSWTYEADTTINGYTYKVLRMQYMSGVFTDHPKYFTIN